MSISGDRCLIGAVGGDSNGSAYIFEWNSTNWSQQAKLTASDGNDGDAFGGLVSMDGDRCVIGAWHDDDNGSSSGSAYIFEWNGISWIEREKLTPSDGDALDYFGTGAGISGNRCIVGANGNDDNGSSSGSAYIFEWNGTSWIQQAKLTVSDAGANDYFGGDVGMSGDRCIVGAFGDDDGGSNGSAYIFEWNGASWIQQEKLKASDGGLIDVFGYSVSISGDRCIISAHCDDDNGFQSGSAYIYDATPCIVDFHHFAIFAQYWLETGTGLPADLYEDNVVDLLDLELFINEWLDYCPADWPLK